jgi:hypothetical protein
MLRKLLRVDDAVFDAVLARQKVYIPVDFELEDFDILELVTFDERRLVADVIALDHRRIEIDPESVRELSC